MCGRYTLTVDQEALAVALGISGLLAEAPSASGVPTAGQAPHPRPRYNIAPTQEAPVVLAGRGLVAHRWGLVPHWARDTAVGSRLINARSETAHRKPSFRDAFRHGRCLVPADGFYEWVSRGSGRTPWWIYQEDRAPFTLAGLRATWTPPGGGEALETFTILTCDAADSIRGLHHRMPVIVPAELRDAWLHGELGGGEVASGGGEAGEASGGERGAGPVGPAGAAGAAGVGRGAGPAGAAEPHPHPELLAAATRAAGALRAHPVSTRVNTPAHDDPGLVDPVEPEEEGRGAPSEGAGEDPPTPLQGSLFGPDL
jgi:putative SOS response-associated peptidase YedK